MSVKLIAAVVLVLVAASPAQAMSPAPLSEPDNVITLVVAGCGPGRTLVNGVCVARTTKRQVRRQVRRCAVWGAGGVCARWY
jgi:hypothetical protein